MQGDVATLNKLYVKSATGQPVPLSTFVKIDDEAGAAAVDQPPEPVPGGDDLASTWRPARRWARR